MSVRLLKVCSLSEPEKEFIICDINDGGEFADPYILRNYEDYDPFGINEEGCVACGGTTDPVTLLAAYSWGIFPWFPYRFDEAYWYCPDKRFVIFPERIHISHSLRNLLNKTSYHITINWAFEKVINNCMKVDDRFMDERAWLGEDLIKDFLEFNEMGYAKSVELWDGEELIGGFYGVWINGVFQGDSMFSLRPSASQIALIKFCQKGEIDGKKLKFIDTQYETPTFKRLGGTYISYEEFRKALGSPVKDLSL